MVVIPQSSLATPTLITQHYPTTALLPISQWTCTHTCFFCRGSQTAIHHFLSWWVMHRELGISTVSQLAIVSQSSGSMWESSKSCYGQRRKPLWSSILVFSWPDQTDSPTKLCTLTTTKGESVCSAAETCMRALIHYLTYGSSCAPHTKWKSYQPVSVLCPPY